MLLVAQIVCGDERHIRVFLGDLLNITLNAFDQSSAKQEIGCDHHFLETEFAGHLDTASYRRISYARIDGFRPTKAQIFTDNPRQLGGICIGVGNRCAATNHNQHGVIQ